MTTLPGSTIVLPSSADLSLPTDRVHILVVPGVRFVNLRLLDFERQVLEDVGCRLRIEGREIHARTDPDGKVAFKISAALADAEALVQVDTEAHGWTTGRGMVLGEIPGVDTPGGQRIRLDNLGYRAVGVDEPEPDDLPSTWAIEEFQCEHGLVVDGDCGPATQAKLLEVHGH